ncbi:MAG: tetratricopeptide repeat protein [Polyangiaceae bacterium]
MFKVECPSCSAPYQVDERRIPSGGLKMRCPKCGGSFQVDPPADPRTTGPSPVLGGALSPPAPKPTMLGVAPTPPRPAPPRPAPPRPGVAPPRPPPTALDLPATPGRPVAPPATVQQAPVALELDDLDLPAVGGRRPAGDLPALASDKATQFGLGNFGELELPGADLPAAVRPADLGGLDLDLPVVGGGRPRAPSFDDELGLPAPRQPEAMPDSLDLPVVAGNPFTQAHGPGDLPTPLGGAGLPALQDAAPPMPSAGLPQIAAGLPATSAGLPVPAAGLPQTAAGLPQAAAGLPQAAAGLPQAAAGLPQTAAGLPQNAAGLPDNASLPPALAGRTAPLGGPSGPIDLGLDEPREWGSEANLGADPAEVVRQQGGGTEFGEVNLDAGIGGEVDLEREAPAQPRGDDDMEFGGIPQELPGGQQPAIPTGIRPIQIAPPPPKRRVGLRAIAAFVVVFVVGGASLSLVPEVGPFGAYWIVDKIQSGDHQKLLADTQTKSRELLGKDTAADARQAITLVTEARTKARRLPALPAYAAYVAFLADMRFGTDPEENARAKVLLDELKDEEPFAELELARAAQQAAGGQADRARQMLTQLKKEPSRVLDASVLEGEMELAAGDGAAAERAWLQADATEKSARTVFGLARAKRLAGDLPGAEKLARQTLERNADHVGAKLLVADVVWRTTRKEEQAVALAEEVTKKADLASNAERVAAHTLLGDIHLARSRISHAEAAFAAALKIDPKAADALAGLGDALYRAGRYSEALARFEAGTQADPTSVNAKVGVAKSTLALERLQDALAMTKRLVVENPKSMRVAYWHGRVQEAQGARKEAAEAYQKAIDLGGKDADVVDAYIALALLENQAGRSEEAQKILTAAKEKLPRTAALYVAFADLALSQGRYEDAVKELEAALKLDPLDVAAKFRMGVAHRKSKHFEEASRYFDEVAKVDKDYPGLALERGLLYEASGKIDEALSAYEAALKKAPNDPDLMLRVGCGYAASGRGAPAEKLLRKVLQQRPSSAETHHCLGRALLVVGSNLAEALKTLQRAADLDPNRAEYHLYVGWAAVEARRNALAEASLKKALELDQGLGDAYWQRGLLRHHQGAVKDAVKDLTRALELKPSRFEAHAALADSYADLGRETDAMNEWQQAIAQDGENATWRYRYGRLLVDNRRMNEAREQLTKAIELGSKMDPRPGWLWEAHHRMARALGRSAAAIPHWQKFLELGPRDSPYREEAIKELKELGKPFEGD